MGGPRTRWWRRFLGAIGALLALALTSASAQRSGDDDEIRATKLTQALLQERRPEPRRALVAELNEAYLAEQDKIAAESGDDEIARRAFLVLAWSLANLPAAEITVDQDSIDILRAAVEVAATLQWFTSSDVTNVRANQDRKAALVWNLAARLRENGRFAEIEAVIAEWLDQLQATSMRYRLRFMLASTCRLQGKWDQALAALDATSTAPPEEMAFLAPLVLEERAQIYLDLGKLDQAEYWFERQQESARDREPGLRLNAALRQASLRIAQRRPQEAVALLTSTLENQELLAAWPRARAELLARRGIALADLALTDQSERTRALADLELARSDPELTATMRTRVLITMVRERLLGGDGDQARELLAAARAHVDALAAPVPSPVSPHRPEIAALQSWLERASHASIAAQSRAREQLLREYQAFLQEWSSTPLFADGVGFLLFANRRMIVAEIIACTIALDPSEQGLASALLEVMRAQAKGTLSRERALGVGTLADVRRELCRAREGVLVYVPARDGGHVFAIDGEHLLHAEISSYRTVGRLRNDLVSEVLQPHTNSEPLDQIAHDLGAELLPANIEAQVRSWSHVTIIGADLFEWLPFECVQLADRRPLGQALAVSYLPSLTIGIDLGRRASDPDRSPHGLALVAAPEHGAPVRDRFPDLQPLPFAATEQDALCRPYQDVGTSVRHGGEATKAALGELLNGKPAVLQILTHGVYLAGETRPAALVLSGSGLDAALLRCDEVERLPAPPLVALTACGTARGPWRSGDDGVSHFGGAFLRAGARAVLLSYGALDYAATVALMKVFHEQLVAGNSPAEALRLARIAVAQEPAHDHPYFHSLVSVIGLGNRTLFAAAAASTPSATPAPSHPWIAAVVVALTLGLVILRLLVRRSAASR